MIREIIVCFVARGIVHFIALTSVEKLLRNTENKVPEVVHAIALFQPSSNMEWDATG